ncbi:hypothetical protein O3G_MSEX012688 [Manduca sexta]|uniref:Lipocalin/cytosolic fatty-acid binding domain-containing protein n=1 Tax=Manduca sexta TaxID=7130 RepID=A0A921ZQE8_MANSE|nr:hypothetical protein O3G_MSEX012688 [Manduca sexta]KAG6461529.1 hypothetical protein O3G_MSEX012688 [Manduca sexta]
MAFLGKEYKLVKHENYDEFLKSLGLPNERVQEMLKNDETEKLVKNGDTYTFYYNSPSDKREVTFTPGLEFVEFVEEGEPIKSTYTIDGNTVHQVSSGSDRVANFTREYDGDNLVVTMTCDKWDGVARAYYKA